MTDLCKLATKYGTDKAGWYTPVYDLLLRDRREQVKTVLEIGVGTKEAMQHVPGYQPGASLRMWREYFPFAAVYGADIVPCNVSNVLHLDQGKASELEYVAQMLGPFDLIVDDGSHQPHHQILGANTLVPFLKKGGLYIIEDVNNFDEIAKGINYKTLCISYPTAEKIAGRCMVMRGKY